MTEGHTLLDFAAWKQGVRNITGDIPGSPNAVNLGAIASVKRDIDLAQGNGHLQGKKEEGIRGRIADAEQSLNLGLSRIHLDHIENRYRSSSVSRAFVRMGGKRRSHRKDPKGWAFQKPKRPTTALLRFRKPLFKTH